MASQIDKLLKIYRTVTQDPSPIGAYILYNSIDSFTVNLTWNQRSLDRGQSVKFQTSHIVDVNSTDVPSFPPVDVSSEILTAVSKSTNLRAVLREIVPEKNAGGKKKQHLEIWKKSSLSSILDLTALDVHGDVYADSEFGSLEWSPCENKLLYVAEKKLPKTESFYKTSPQDEGKESETSDKKAVKGEEYVYREDWGEALVGKHHPVVVVCNIKTEKLKVLEGIPDYLSPGQVTWAPDGGIVGVGWTHILRRLGLIYCTNRSSCIFHLTSDGEFNTLSSSKDDLAVRSPRFSPYNDFLLWLERPATGPHHSAHRLIRFDWATKTSTTLVDIVNDHCTISDGNEFYGLYSSALLRRCFISPNQVVISTPQKFVNKSYIVNTDTKSIMEIPIGDLGSLVALDVFEDKIICAYSSLRHPWEIKFTRYIDGKLTGFNTIKFATPNPGLEHFGIDYISLQAETNDAWVDYSAIYLGPTNKTQSKSVPLVLFPHGGPHSAFSDSYTTSCAVFALMGYAVVMVNYRGSTGQGQDSVNFLPGRVGDTDVKDCHNTAVKVCEKYSYLDPDRIVLYGGSHGGFLVTHLSGQYPTDYKATVALNPVIDVAAMTFVTDITDWAAVEAGLIYTPTLEADLTPEQLTRMRNVSPLQYAHQVKTPTLILLGKKDLRVPMSQGLSYYHALKALNVKTRVLVYEDNHPLSQVPVELDSLLNSALWFLEHTNHTI